MSKLCRRCRHIDIDIVHLNRILLNRVSLGGHLVELLLRVGLEEEYKPVAEEEVVVCKRLEVEGPQLPEEETFNPLVMAFRLRN